MRTIHPTQAPEYPPDDKPSFSPAGKVIAVVVLALLLGGLFDADSLYASVSSQRFGPARTVELDLVRPFRAVSDALRLNLPHRWLAEIAGTNQAHPKDSFLDIPPITPDALAIRALINPVVDRPRPAAAHHRARTRTRVVPKAPTRPRPVTAASPMRVWIAGDSLIGALADAFLAHVAGNAAVPASTDVQIGTGLARPDVYDWPGSIAAAMQKQQPNVVIVTFGANDAQDMVAGGTYMVRDTPAWQAEYARRVALVMSEVAGSGRMLVWIEVPPVTRPRLQTTGQIINGIVRTQARLHPGVVVVDPAPALTINGAFATYLPGPSGTLIQVRDADGIHLTPAGASRVLPLLLAAIRQVWAVP